MKKVIKIILLMLLLLFCSFWIFIYLISPNDCFKEQCTKDDIVFEFKKFIVWKKIWRNWYHESEFTSDWHDNNKFLISYYENIGDHLGLVEEIIVDKHIDEYIKIEMIKYTTCMDKSEYIAFGNYIFNELKKNTISVDIFYQYLSPSIIFGTFFHDYYKEEKVDDFLEKIRIFSIENNNRNVDILKLKEIVDHIREGVTKSMLDSYRTLDTYPAFYCARLKLDAEKK